MLEGAIRLLRLVGGTLRDLAPIILIVGFFQIVVLRQPLPDPAGLLGGLAFTMLGLAFFLRGLEMALFPLGEALAGEFAKKGSLFWLLAFGFGLGFGTTAAEPALIAVAGEAARTLAEAGAIPDSQEARDQAALELRGTVALAVGAAIVIGIWRILTGWPIAFLIVGGYILVVVLTPLAPPEIVGIAYDSGGVTTSTITVPLVTALGIGLATVIRGRNPLVDGFGLIAFASLMPILFVLLYGILA